MITIPAIADAKGVLTPATPIPAGALAVQCDGTVYRVAETPEEAAILCPPPEGGAEAPPEG